jgi:hypothetical protein
METWCKLFSSIVTSTVWQESLPTKVVWITLLALKDYTGVVHGSIPGLAHLAGVSVKECEEAIRVLSSPDKYSRSQENEGRRLKAVDGGWVILNHLKYRDEKADYRRDYNRRKQAEYRAAKKLVQETECKRQGVPLTLAEKLEIGEP